MTVCTENFWIRYAGLFCRVISSVGMKAIFTKYYSGTYVSVFENGPRSLDTIAELIIRQKEGTLNETNVTIKRKKLKFSISIVGSVHFYYPLLTSVLQRIFMALWYDNGGIVFHASAVESQGKAYVFVGDSGSGKTTIVRLLNSQYGLKVLADNQVFIRKHREEYVVYPFPFTQYHKDGNKIFLPIASFYILHKSLSFAVKTLTFIESVRALGHEIQILDVGDFPFSTQIPTALRRIIFDFTKTVVMKRLYFFQGKGLWEAIQGS
jgi:hypothetical protein